MEEIVQSAPASSWSLLQELFSTSTPLSESVNITQRVLTINVLKIVNFFDSGMLLLAVSSSSSTSFSSSQHNPVINEYTSYYTVN